MQLKDVVTAEAFTSVAQFALREPPSWTRLEPQSVTGDPAPGLEARVHDPLWLLMRQWQLGEFAGEDTGRPISVRIGSTTSLVSRWQPGAWDVAAPAAPRDFVVSEPRVDAAGNQVVTREGELIEPLIEREPSTVDGPGLRARAEAGAVFLAALDDAGLSAFKGAVLAQCPLDGGPADPNDPSLARLALMLAGRIPDGEQLCAALEAAAGLPPWLTPADAGDGDALLEIVGEWTAWYRTEVSPPAADVNGSWVSGRLEYRFSIASRTSSGEVVLRAPECRGGAIDWYSFDVDANNPTLGVPDAMPQAQDQVLLATPLSFPGMPADRLWEFEDAAVSIGLLEAEPHDLARLLLVEFAMTYGSDWLVLPLDVPHGSLTTIQRVTYLTNFGERFVVQPTSIARAADSWRMFVIAGSGGASVNALFVPPAAVQMTEGRAIEEVLFLRDEMANLGWGVERMISGRSGDPRRRSDERRSDTSRPDVPPVPSAELDYVLETPVPPQWIPYVPRTDGYRSIELVRGALVRFVEGAGTPVQPLGRLLNEASTARLLDAEVPREGVTVSRVPVVARRADGSYVRWIARRVGVARGQGSSSLAFDSAASRKPPL